MARIFISYRRQDSPSMTGRIYDQLEEAFGHNRLFRDINDIDAGQDFRAKIAQEIGKSDVLLVIIGPKWESITDNQGNRRLDNPNDFVRLEVEEGLKHPGKVVIPVLVENTPMPAPESLPKSMQELCYRNAISVRQDPDFHPDMQKLISQIRRIPKGSTPASKKTPVLIGAGLLALICLAAILVGGLLYLKATPNLVTSDPTTSPTGTDNPIPITSTFTDIPPIDITEIVTETNRPPASGPIRIGVVFFRGSIFTDVLKRLNSLGFAAEALDASAGYKEFSKYEVIYLALGWAFEDEVIEHQASDYQRFVKEGGGLVVEQPNARNKFIPGLLPYGMVFERISLENEANGWPPDIRVKHEIVANLRTTELPGPGNAISTKDHHWQVITTSAKFNSPTLVIAEYGEGRIVVLASSISKHEAVQHPLGDHFIKRFIEWVSNLKNP